MPKRKDKHRLQRGPVGWLQYAGMRIFSAIINVFPVEANYGLCRLLGDLMYRFDRRHRERATRHLRLSFPDWPQRRIEKVARKSLRNLVFLGLEVLFTPRLIRPNRWRQYITLERMAETLRLLVERRSGLIMLTGHFGNWEVLGYTLATLGFPTVSVARRLDNPRVDEFVLGVREKTGQRIIDKRGASTMVDPLLQQREAIGFIADQDAGKKGVFVDFFGRKASAYKTIALLAMRHQVPIVCGYARRDGERYHFTIGANRIIHPHEWVDRDDPVRWITQEYTTALEEMVQAAPEQYLWVHRRWKHRPKGEPQPSDGIA